LPHAHARLYGGFVTELRYVDHRADPAAWAAQLDVSREAIDLYLDSEIIDLHIDSFIWTRVFSYDLLERHDEGLFGARFYSQADFPRIREAQIAGGIWVITTNPTRASRERLSVWKENLDELSRIIASVPDDFACVRNLREYRAARASGRHAAFIGIQGGNAVEDDPSVLDDRVLRVTLVHLSTSALGATSSPLRFGEDHGLSERGRDFVRVLNEKKIFVDLAHISKRGFWDALAVHDKTQPAIVTHTGISGAFEHWRNLDDAQVKAIANLGGTIGIMYQSSFLGDPYWGGRASAIVDHIDHVVKTVGEDFVSLGSDWDGAILPPRDMKTCLELPRLVDLMLQRGYSDTRIRKVLGQNFLRTLGSLRGA
jgi:membrane dipeptidase